jgi:hypothetical protein
MFMNVPPGAHGVEENTIHIKKNEFDGSSLFFKERRWFCMCGITWIIAGRFHSEQLIHQPL